MDQTHSNIPKPQQEPLEMNSVADALLEEETKKNDHNGGSNDEIAQEQKSQTEEEAKDDVEENASASEMKWHLTAKARQYVIHPKLLDVQQFTGLFKKPSKAKDLGNNFTDQQKEQYEQWLKGLRQGRGWESPRMLKLVEIVNTARSSDPACKFVIVDDSVFVLDIVQIALNDTDKTLDVFRLDGRIDEDEAIDIVKHFANAKPPAVILVSKVGLGFKPTLNMANTLIICSPMWKVSDEEQALSRVYNLGQTRAVSMYYLNADECLVEKWMLSRGGRR